MSKFFLDTEFHEYEKPVKVLGVTAGKVPTVELISIGIVDGNNNTYYAISRDFDLKAAWENEWLRHNVLNSIHTELCEKAGSYAWMYHSDMFADFTFNSMRNLIKWYGTSNKMIATEIIQFVYRSSGIENPENITDWEYVKEKWPINFYGYYCDYDWVVFCQLFGRMIDLPDGFPMYCRDLKQMMDERNLDKAWKDKNCPEPKGAHNALVDAGWNKSLYREIQLVVNNS